MTVTDRMAKRFTGKRIDLSSEAMRRLTNTYNMKSIRTMKLTESLVKGKYKVLNAN